MLNPAQEWQPILTYPSPASVAELTLAMLESKAEVVHPEGWPDNEPLYLRSEIESLDHTLRDAIEVAISRAEPGRSLSRELRRFEQTIAADVLEHLESTAEGRIVLAAIGATATEKYRKDRIAAGEEEQGDDSG